MEQGENGLQVSVSTNRRNARDVLAILVEERDSLKVQLHYLRERDAAPERIVLTEIAIAEKQREITEIRKVLSVDKAPGRAFRKSRYG